MSGGGRARLVAARFCSFSAHWPAAPPLPPSSPPTTLSSPRRTLPLASLPADLPAMRPVHLHGAALEACPGPQLQLSPRSAPEGLPQHLERQTAARSGRQVVAPLRRADGTRVLAVLGWVPSDAALPSPARLPPAAPPGGALAGVLRRTVEPSVWGVAGTPSAGASSGGSSSSDAGSSGGSDGSSASQGVYPFLNTAALAEACGLSAARGDVVDAVLELIAPFPEPPVPRAAAAAAAAAQGAPLQQPPPPPAAPWPVTRQLAQLETASLAPPYTHLIYAATWGTLAVFGGLATLRRARGGLGRGGVRRLAKA